MSVKILIVHNDYQQSGGERAAVRALIELLRSRDQDPLVFWRDNAEISRYGAWEKAVFFPATIYNRGVYREVRALVERDRPTIAHIHNVFPLISPSVYRALSDAGVPVLQTLHNFRLLCPNGLFFTRGHNCERCAGGNTAHAAFLRCYRGSFALSALYATAIGLHRRAGTFDLIDRFIALTPFLAEKVVAAGLAAADRVRVLGNFITRPAVVEPQPRPRPYVIYLGRLSVEKGPVLAATAMAGIPEIDLVILGDGPQLAHLQSLGRSQKNVHPLGHVGGEERWRLLRGAMAMVVPSVCYEAMPLSVLESMAVGTPVVASNIGSLPSLVEHGVTGLLFDPGNAADLAAQVRVLMGDPATAAAMGRAGAALVRARFSPEAHYQALLAIYGELQSAGASI